MRCKGSRRTSGVRVHFYTKVDLYEDIPFKDEKVRLDVLAERLKNDQDVKGVIIVYWKIGTWAQQAQERANRAKKYLMTKHGFKANEIEAVYGGYEEKIKVELHIFPAKFFQ